MDTAEQYEESNEDQTENQEEQNEELNEELNEESNPLEEKARQMGWVPEEDFRGDKANWRSAEDFVDRGEKMIPILNKKIRDLRKSQDEKDKAFAKYLGDMRTKLHDQKLQDHEQEKQKAVDEGDTDAYNRLSNNVPVNDLPEYTPPESTVDPDFERWIEDNSWYNDDYERQKEANAYHDFLLRSKPQLTTAESLNEVSTHIKKKFSNPNRSRPSAVDGGSQKASGTAENLYNTLDAEGKKMFNIFVTQGVFKNTKEDREAYARDVFG